jgi:hypothetical protein
VINLMHLRVARREVATVPTQAAVALARVIERVPAQTVGQVRPRTARRRASHHG